MAAIVLGVLLGGCESLLALDPSLDVSQYGHTAWKIRDGFSTGTAFAMAQTPDGYLWLGTEFGLFRSDGVRFSRWEPPAGEHLPGTPYSLLVAHDGTLWIGTFEGLARWKDAKLTLYPQLDKGFVTSLLEDHEGTVWAGTLGYPVGSTSGRLWRIDGGTAQCYGQNGEFGSFVWSLSEDGSGAIWVGGETGLWRWRPGPPKRYETRGKRLADLTQSPDGHLIAGIRDAGLMQIAGDKLLQYPIRSVSDPKALMSEHDIDSNKLLRDRDGGLWIGTNERGLIHVHQGRTDVFTETDGLSGNIIAGIFEDREGSIWVSTAGGLDRFRDVAVTTLSPKQGLSSRIVNSVMAAEDGSVWTATRDGLTRWQNGKSTTFRTADGLPDDFAQSLYEDAEGRVWVFTGHGLAYFKAGRFVAVPGIPSAEVYSITGDDAGNLWLSGNGGLSHLRQGRMVEHFPWSVVGRTQQAKVIIADHGGLWLGFWDQGGVEYFKDGQVGLSYTTANGLAKGNITSLRLDRRGALWAATMTSGVSRIKDGHVINLTTGNGLPCEKVIWTIEDEDHSLWLYTGCGLVRVAAADVEAWIADPTHRFEPTVWDAADGVLLVGGPSSFGPTYAQSADGKLWYPTREDIQVVDPRHLAFNKLPPPVHIERVVADDKTYWQNLFSAPASPLHLPARTHDLQIYYTAISLVAPEKVNFKYRLEGQDNDWREVANDRDVQYSNLGPGSYTFRVIASNNSGVWNLQGDTLEFSVAPAYYQTNWFRALCALALLALLWAVYLLRVRQLHHEFALTVEARVSERTSVARELHDTLLQSGHGLLLRLQIISQLLPDRPLEAKEQIDTTIERAAKAITEGRDAVQGLRASTVQTNDLAQAVSTLGEELVADAVKQESAPAVSVTVEGEARDLHPILRDEIYRIAAEALRNAYRHAEARQIEVEIRYDNEQFRLRVRDDGKGIDQAFLSGQETVGHFGLPGMRERARVIGGRLVVWSEVDAGTEVELRIPAGAAYAQTPRRAWLSKLLAGKDKS